MMMMETLFWMDGWREQGEVYHLLFERNDDWTWPKENSLDLVVEELLYGEL